jgi:predicted MFS family arabinose efflux permease
MAFVARMPIGTLSLALLLHVRDISGSFATAGTTVGAYLVAMAVGAPLQGRLIDRRGPRGVLLVTGTVQPIAMAVVLFARPLALPSTAIVGLAIVAGALAPPVSVLTRTLWRHRFAHDDDRQTAFAIDAVLIECNYTLGPALVASLVALAGPATAFAMALVFAIAAAPLFLLSGAARYWAEGDSGPRHLLGPLTEPRLLRVFAVSALLAFALGLLEVGYPGFAAAAAMPAFGGVLIAINSTGSALGGIAYGGLRPTLPVPRQLAWLLMLMALPVAAHVPVTSPWLLAALALVAGIFIAPSITALTVLVAQIAPQRYATEAFTWSITAIVSGVGAGSAVGGVLIEAEGVAAAFALSAASAFAGGLLAAASMSAQAGRTRRHE